MKLYFTYGSDPKVEGIGAAFLIDDFGDEVFIAGSNFISQLAYRTVNNGESADAAHIFAYAHIDYDL